MREETSKVHLEATLTTGKDQVTREGGEIVAYADFWDVPRVMVVRGSNHDLLLESHFLDAQDDYDDCYEVYRLERRWNPATPLARTAGLEKTHLGRLAVDRIHFDVTRRRSLEFEDSDLSSQGSEAQ